MFLFAFAVAEKKVFEGNGWKVELDLAQRTGQISIMFSGRDISGTDETRTLVLRFGPKFFSEVEKLLKGDSLRAGASIFTHPRAIAEALFATSEKVLFTANKEDQTRPFEGFSRVDPFTLFPAAIRASKIKATGVEQKLKDALETLALSAINQEKEAGNIQQINVGLPTGDIAFYIHKNIAPIDAKGLMERFRGGLPRNLGEELVHGVVATLYRKAGGSVETLEIKRKEATFCFHLPYLDSDHSIPESELRDLFEKVGQDRGTLATVCATRFHLSNNIRQKAVEEGKSEKEINELISETLTKLEAELAIYLHDRGYALSPRALDRYQKLI